MTANNEEYKAIRAEMLKWQDRRFDLIKHSTSVVTGLLGFKLVVGAASPGSVGTEHWPLVTGLLLLYLSAINVVMWYAGRANSKLAAYLIVFHEEPVADGSASNWESRLQILKSKQLDKGNLNVWLSLIQLVLGLLSAALPFATANFGRPDAQWTCLVVGSAIAFLGTLALVYWHSYPRKAYETHWTAVKNEEAAKRARAMHKDA